MRNEGVPIAKEGIPFLGILLFSGVAALVSGWKILAVPFLLLAGFVAYFFRNPERLAPVGAGLVVSPADGKVIFVGEAIENEFTKERFLKISIFMSVFDVHINRVPIDGTIRNIRYHRGSFIAAFDDNAPDQNERNAILIQTPKNSKVVLVQIAGLIARRIACYPAIGEFVMKGQRFGLIRFGSRCDVYLPTSSKIRVKMGDRVIGGETIVGEIQEAVTAGASS